MKKLDNIALILLIIGAMNYGSRGLFGLDFISTLCGDLTGIIFTLIGLVGLWAIGMLWDE